MPNLSPAHYTLLFVKVIVSWSIKKRYALGTLQKQIDRIAILAHNAFRNNEVIGRLSAMRLYQTLPIDAKWWEN